MQHELTKPVLLLQLDQSKFASGYAKLFSKIKYP